MARIVTAFVALGLTAGGALAQDAAATRSEIEAALGQVPTMFQVFPDRGLPGAWSELQSLQLNPETALDNRTKELIGLAVAAQIPCEYCIYFHTKAAAANGASEEQIREAVAMAAIVRHWSTVLNGMQVDPATFRSEVDAMMAGAEAAATN